MKFFLVLAALLALSSASALFRDRDMMTVDPIDRILFRGRDITFDPIGRILISGYDGKHILFNTLDGRKFLEIVEPNMPNKMIEIVDDDLFNTYDKTDLVFGTKTFHRYLVHLLQKLEDVLEQQSYHNLLMSVNNAYNKGYYTNTMYDLENRMMVNDLIRDNQIVRDDGVYGKYHGLMGLYGKQNGLGYYNRYAPEFQGRHNVFDYYGNMDATRYGMDTTRFVNPFFQHYYNKIARQPVYNQYYHQYDNVVPFDYEYYNQIPSMYKHQDKSMMRGNMVMDKMMHGNWMGMDKMMHRDLVTDMTYPIHHIYGNGYGYGLQHQQPFVYQNERVHQYEPIVPQMVY